MSHTVTDNHIVFVDKSGKAEKLDLFQPVESTKAINALFGEQKAAESASKAAVSLLSDMLNNPRIDAYKGKTPLDARVPSELNNAIRELETEFLKPLFVQSRNKAKPEAIEKEWQGFIGNLRAGGSYAVAKGEVTKYFAMVGKLPIADNGMLLSVAAIKKIIKEAKDILPAKESGGIADKLITLSKAISEITDDEKLGNLASGVAALKAMLAVYEAKYEESAKALTTVIGNTDAAAKAAISKMQRAPAPVTV